MTKIVNGNNLSKEDKHKLENIIKILENFRTSDDIKIASYSLETGEIVLDNNGNDSETDTDEITRKILSLSETSELENGFKSMSETSELESESDNEMRGGNIGEIDTIFSITEIKNKKESKNKLSRNLFKMRGGSNKNELKDKMQTLGITSDSTDSICE